MNRHFIVNGLRIFWLIITLWNELGVFLNSVRHCRWPDSAISVTSPGHRTPTHVLLVADPQILDHRSYPERGPYLTYLTQLVVDLNLRKSWWAALRKQPDAVIFLGDMMDGGRFNMLDDEYESYYHRFQSIFGMPLNIPAYFIPGNHDIGLRSSPMFSPSARSRYTSHFGPLNSQVTIADHLFVLLDAPGLVEEDDERINRAKTFSEWTPRAGGPLELVKSIAEDIRKPVMLFSHIPLSRHMSDCGPLREKGTIRSGIGFGYQNTLRKEASNFLLEQLRPVIVFSGDDHDYCEINHTFSINGTESVTREISVKSLSMAMGIKRPGFQLLSLASPDPATTIGETQASVLCVLPDQIAIYLSTYVPLLLLSLSINLISNAIRVRNLRSSTRRHNRRSSSPQPDLILRVRQAEYSSEDESSSDAPYLLPQPASSRLRKSNTQRYTPYTSAFSARWRRFGCPDILRRLSHCDSLSSRVSRQQKYQKFWPGFARDSTDVAVFPLTLFVVISVWMTFN